jgi:hypothetical protein
MSSCRKLSMLVAFALCLPMVSCMRRQSAVRPPGVDAVKAAREYRQNYSAPGAHATEGQITASTGNVDADDIYERQIQHSFNLRDFNRLEKEAHDARGGKVRFSGGIWELSSFYLGVTKLADREPSTEASWTAHLTTAKVWASAMPESVTAQLALAESYVNYAWFARGSGYADSVTDEGWKSFQDRIEIANSILLKTARLKEKCPFWYEVMQHVALAQGWDKSLARELMEQAVQFEPDYYAYYREFAYYLEPKWYGAKGEADAFAEEISNRVGGKEGAFLYFEIASLLTCQCGQDPTHMKYLSWPKIKEGYAALDELYGLSNLKRNRYAYMASRVGDKAATREAIAEIGDNWVQETWYSHDRYQAVAAWAESH